MNEVRRLQPIVCEIGSCLVYFCPHFNKMALYHTQLIRKLCCALLLMIALAIEILMSFGHQGATM
uniref:Uncharacterized protein n=1 Tax=Anopheles minimus TaxID=112268 RepID=A0A182WC01_9DIPT